MWHQRPSNLSLIGRGFAWPLKSRSVQDQINSWCRRPRRLQPSCRLPVREEPLDSHNFCFYLSRRLKRNSDSAVLGDSGCFSFFAPVLFYSFIARYVTVWFGHWGTSAWTLLLQSDAAVPARSTLQAANSSQWRLWLIAVVVQLYSKKKISKNKTKSCCELLVNLFKAWEASSPTAGSSLTKSVDAALLINIHCGSIISLSSVKMGFSFLAVHF